MPKIGSDHKSNISKLTMRAFNIKDRYFAGKRQSL